MSEEQLATTSAEETQNWRTRVLLIGGLIGSLLGLLSAFLYIRSAEERYAGRPPEAPGTGDTVRLGISLLSIIRTIAEWGSR